MYIYIDTRVYKSHKYKYSFSSLNLSKKRRINSLRVYSKLKGIEKEMMDLRDFFMRLNLNESMLNEGD